MKTSVAPQPDTQETSDASTMRLSQAQAGTRHKITDLDTSTHDAVQKMILMGALPGKAVEVIQRFPSFLIGLGNSQFAIDRELAEQIVVVPLPN